MVNMKKRLAKVILDKIDFNMIKMNYNIKY